MKEKRAVGIVGGTGAVDLLNAFLGTEDVIIEGVLDKNEDSRFIRVAKKLNIFTTCDPVAFIKKLRDKTIVDLSDGWYKVHVPSLDGEVKLVAPDTSALLVAFVKERKRLLKTQSALERVSEIIVSTFDLKRILNLVIYIASRLLKVEICSVRLLEPNGKLKMIASSGLSRRYLKKGDMKLGESIAGWVVKNKKPYFSPNLKKDPLYNYSPYAQTEGISSLLCVPLIVKSIVAGSLTVYSSSLRKFSAAEVKLFTAFANQVAVVLENARLYKDVEESYLGLLEALGVVVETRDFYTADHSKEVKNYAVAVAKKMGLSPEEVEAIAYVSLIHDLGKIGVEEKILGKPDKLTAEEFKKIAAHSSIGANIIGHIKVLRHFAPIVLHIHERYDGKGYPGGLKGEDIPLGSRVLLVADAFSAMTSDRPYRKAMPAKKATAELKANSGTQFDPGVVDAFLSVLPCVKS